MNAFVLEIWHTVLMMAPWLFIGAFVIGLLHVVLPKGFFERALSGRGGIFNAVLLGVPLPLCSCAVIPVAVGMRQSGAPKSSTLSFLISTPQTGVDSIMVTGAFLGWPFAVYRVFVAVTMGLFGGGLTKSLSLDSDETSGNKVTGQHDNSIRAGLMHAWTSLESIWGWVLIGVIASAGIAQFGMLGESIGIHQSPVLGSLIALVIAVPLYVCATASIPIAASLVAAGLPIEAALVFLIAGPATNTATIGAVYSSLGRNVTVLYVMVTVIGSLAFAWVFTMVLPDYTIIAADHHMHGASLWEIGLGVCFGAVTLFWGRGYIAKFRSGENRVGESRHEVFVDGMTCQGCVRKLQKALNETEGTAGTTVELSPGRVFWSAKLDHQLVAQVVEETGYRVGMHSMDEEFEK